MADVLQMPSHLPNNLNSVWLRWCHRNCLSLTIIVRLLRVIERIEFYYEKNCFFKEMICDADTDFKVHTQRQNTLNTLQVQRSCSYTSRIEYGSVVWCANYATHTQFDSNSNLLIKGIFMQYVLLNKILLSSRYVKFAPYSFKCDLLRNKSVQHQRNVETALP